MPHVMRRDDPYHAIYAAWTSKGGRTFLYPMGTSELIPAYNDRDYDFFCIMVLHSNWDLRYRKSEATSHAGTGCRYAFGDPRGGIMMMGMCGYSRAWGNFFLDTKARYSDRDFVLS